MAVDQTVTLGKTTHGNLQKHRNPNKVQQWLITRFHHRVAKLIHQTRADVLLDVGCGEGFSLDHFVKDDLKIDYFGTDIRLDALQWARSNLFPTLAGSVADIHCLPFAKNTFPLVICLEVLEHLPDSTAGLVELARVSSEYLILSVPHEPYFRTANFLRGKHLAQLGNDPEHLHNYSGWAFRRMVSAVADVIWHGYTFPWQIVLARKRR
ncbi:MAG: class I SAM-dependent methyltransferase [Chloroflexi bacterium]|nr:class I SAM-dependent methyltransferase [Chloroflexota bacterium]MCI0725297.1 class I SAM-dependent methyltransferase [Chloroflexota bacterium]